MIFAILISKEKRTMKNQSGFTLIELLVVIAILAVLFGVTALALNGVGANAAQVTQQAEQDVVQTAIDVYMAQHAAVTVVSPAAQVGPTNAEFGVYLRRASKYYYCWNTHGVLTQYTTAGTACP
jgi:prepilin-type N-terminal cleavage/methylation domain-containing protein